jgi:hypothetical protein
MPLDVYMLVRLSQGHVVLALPAIKAAAGAPPHDVNITEQHCQPMLPPTPHSTFPAGHKPRPRLLLDLWGAQQPPGRMSRLLPGLRRALSKTLCWGALLTAGFAAGLKAHQLLPRAGAAHEEL